MPVNTITPCSISAKRGVGTPIISLLEMPKRSLHSSSYSIERLKRKFFRRVKHISIDNIFYASIIIEFFHPVATFNKPGGADYQPLMRDLI
jgi:hypothetical protein